MSTPNRRNLGARPPLGPFPSKASQQRVRRFGVLTRKAGVAKGIGQGVTLAWGWAPGKGRNAALCPWVPRPLAPKEPLRGSG